MPPPVPSLEIERLFHELPLLLNSIREQLQQSFCNPSRRSNAGDLIARGEEIVRSIAAGLELMRGSPILSDRISKLRVFSDELHHLSNQSLTFQYVSREAPDQ
jgi:hypothetical protein